MISPEDAAEIMLKRRMARRGLQDYIVYTSRGTFKTSIFSQNVCAAVDQFILDVNAGKRPILVLQAPPQHGKSEMISRKLPAYLLGSYPHLNIATASYSEKLAHTMSQHVRRNLFGPEHQRLFPAPAEKGKYDLNRIGEFTAPGGTGNYVAVGVGTGLTGVPVDIGIIDDPTKDAQEALSPVTKETHWNWYQSVFNFRMSERSGQIIMATSWAQDDLPGRILEMHKGSERLIHLRFPAINDPNETGYNPELPLGPLCPGLHSLEQLLEFKATTSDYWWSALYQQSPKTLGGNIFKEEGAQYYLPKDLPKHFDRVITSWDCTFKDTDGTDFVCGTVWGKKAANVYLLDLVCKRMSFTETVKAVIALKVKWPASQEILIEDKANGPAVIDVLSGQVQGIIAVPANANESKISRAHSVTWVWEAKNVFIPHVDIAPWVRHYIHELTHFPTAAHDDQVDSTTQALRHLYPLFGGLNISNDAIRLALGR